MCVCVDTTVVLTVEPNPAFTGENVTFTCDKDGEEEGWSLSKDDLSKDDVSVKSTDQNHFVLPAERVGEYKYKCLSHPKTPEGVQRSSNIETLTVLGKSQNLVKY